MPSRNIAAILTDAISIGVRASVLRTQMEGILAEGKKNYLLEADPLEEKFRKDQSELREAYDKERGDLLQQHSEKARVAVEPITSGIDPIHSAVDSLLDEVYKHDSLSEGDKKTVFEMISSVTPIEHSYPSAPYDPASAEQKENYETEDGAAEEPETSEAAAEVSQS